MKHKESRTFATGWTIYPALLALASAALCVASLLHAPSASAQQKLLIAHTGTPGNSVYIFWDEFAKRVERYSGGKLKPEVHPSGELGGDDQLLQSLKLGTVDMASASTGNMGAMTKALLWADLPYVFSSRSGMRKTFSDPAITDALRKQIEKEVGTEPLGYIAAGGFRMLQNKKRLLKVPTDTKGIKFRTTASPLDVALISAWGGLPSQVAWSETFTAVQQGVVDGLNLQPVWTQLNGFGQLLKYATRNQAVMGLHCVQINLKKWQGLVPELKQAVQKAVAEATQVADNADAAGEEEFVAKLQKGGMTVYTPTRDEMEQWRKAALPVWDKFRSQIDASLLARIQAVQK